jgi:alpha-tubulin suppressor-like RCC1 family protein
MSQKLCERYSDIYHREDLEKYDDIIYENCILFDSRLCKDLHEIVPRLTKSTFILFYDFFEETYIGLKNKLKGINYNNDVSITNIAFFQHIDNYYIDFHRFIGTEFHYFNDGTGFISWNGFKDFCTFLVNEIRIANLDLMMCKIYSDERWRKIIRKLEINIDGLNIRSSDDNTGHVILDGDWILESEEVETNMIGIYFTPEIVNVVLSLGITESVITNTLISANGRSLYFAGYGYNDTNTGFNTEAYFRRVKYFNNSISNFNVLSVHEKIIHICHHQQSYIFSTNKNKCYSFGKNTNGILGINNTNENLLQLYPTSIVFQDGDVLSSNKIVQIETPANAFVILCDNGQVYGSGLNTAKQLGTNPSLNSKSYLFKRLSSFSYQSSDEYAIKIACGEFRTFVLTNHNKVYSCGSNQWGATARNTQNDNSSFGLCLYFNALTNNENIIKLCATSDNVIIITDQNRVYGAGNNQRGQLVYDPGAYQSKFRRQTLNTNITTIKEFYPSYQGFFIRNQDDDYFSIGLGTEDRPNLSNTNVNTATWVNVAQDIYSLSNNSHMRYLSIRHRYLGSRVIGRTTDSTLVNENNEVFSWGNSHTDKTMGANLADNTIKTSPVRTYISSTSDSSNYFTDAAYGMSYPQMLTVSEVESLNTEAIENYEFTYDDSLNFIVDLSTNSYILHLDTDLSYIDDISFTLTRGIYRLKNIDISSGIAIINNDVSDVVQYNGSNLVSTSLGPDNTTYYKYYSGEIYLYVQEEFSSPISLYSLDPSYAYMGTQNKIIYLDDPDLYEQYINVTTTDTQLDISGSYNLYFMYDGSGNTHASITNDASYTVYTNRQYEISNNDVISISFESIRYALSIDSDISDQLIIKGEEYNAFIEISDNIYYDNSFSFRVNGDLSMNIDLLIYDKITNETLEIYNFIYYNDNVQTNILSALLDKNTLEDVIDFDYQPFNYTLSGNENHYTVGATLIYSDLRTHDSVGTKSTTLFETVLVRKSNNATWKYTNSGDGTFYINSNGDYNFITTDYTYAQASALYPYFAKIGSTSGNNEIFQRDGSPVFHSSINITNYGDFTDVFSHHFALSHDYPLTKTSLLFPVHYIVNGSNHRVVKAPFITLYFNNNTTLSTADAKHYEWNEMIRQTTYQRNKDIYLYALILGTKDFDFSGYNFISHRIRSFRFKNIYGFNIMDFNNNATELSSYEQEYIYSLNPGIVYRFDVPSTMKIAFVSNIEQSKISITSSVHNNNSTQDMIYLQDLGTSYELFSETVFIRLDTDISSATTINIYDDTASQITQNYLLASYTTNSSTMEIDLSMTYEIDLSYTGVNDFHYYYDASRGIIPYVLDTSDQLLDNKLYSNRKINTSVSKTYSIQNVPSFYPLSIINYNNSDYIEITGDISKSIESYLFDASYTFYWGDISLVVHNKNFIDISNDTFEIYSSYNGGTYVSDLFVQNSYTIFVQVVFDFSSQSNLFTDLSGFYNDGYVSDTSSIIQDAICDIYDISTTNIHALDFSFSSIHVDLTWVGTSDDLSSTSLQEDKTFTDSSYVVETAFLSSSNSNTSFTNYIGTQYTLSDISFIDINSSRTTDILVYEDEPSTETTSPSTSYEGFLETVSSFDGIADVSAVCVLDISVSTVSELFSVQLDVSNIDDISMSTCSFSINYDASKEPFSDISFSLATVKSGNASTGYVDQRVYKDIIRKITKQVTGSTHTADLFTNESEVATIVKNTDISLCDNLNDIIKSVNTDGFQTVSNYQNLTLTQNKRFYAMAHTLLAFILDASGDYPTPYETLKTNIENEYTNNNNTLPITVKYGFTKDQYVVVRISYFPSSESNILFSDINYKCLLHLV